MEKPIKIEYWSSDCCGTPTSMPEFGICPRCKEHCTFIIPNEDGTEKVYEL